MKTIKEIKRTCKHHHTATFRGYVSRKSEGIVSEYEGKFGKGYIIDLPNWDSTRYAYRSYWIEEEN